MTETPTCHSCKEPLSKVGRPVTVSTNRYCMKRACQNARMREYRRVTGETQIVMETRPCYHCGTGIAPRPSRSTDSPVGRWCQKTACRRDRSRRLAIYHAIEDGTLSTKGLIESAILFREAYDDKTRLACPDCELGDAIPGYAHLNPGTMQLCTGTGIQKITPEDAKLAWPHLFQENS